MSAAATRPPWWYAPAWLAVLPLAALYLLWRGRRQPEYRQHWAERFLGSGAAEAALADAAPVIWVHAVSLGETRAAAPLIEQLARQYPRAGFVLTHMTPTGRAAGADIVRTHPGRVVQRYLPYDTPFAVARFFAQIRPQVGVLMETEIWPQLLHSARARGVPLVLANARLSPRSLAKALRQRSLMQRAAAAFTVVGAQTADDAQRIGQIYSGPLQITGNAKFDMTVDAQKLAQGRQWRAQLAQHDGAPVWLFASTREGEEALIIAALRQCGLWPPALTRTSPSTAPAMAHPPAASTVTPRLLFVPRHPQRFNEVAALLQQEGATVLRRALWPDGFAEAGGPAVLLGDSLGEMALYYGMADVALIGGSLLPLGGQNLIEACACGCPVVLGPHMFNFAGAADDAVAAGAAVRAGDAVGAVRALQRISADAALRQRIAAAGLEFAAAHRGATARTAELICRALASE